MKIKKSAVKVVKRETDLKAIYENVNPTYYGVIVCPGCGHARFEKDFHDVNEATKQLIRKEVSIKWCSKDYCDARTLEEAIEVHKLALFNYNVTEYKFSAIGKVCLRLSWYYRELNSEYEKKFVNYAADSYEKAFIKEDLFEDPREELKILYLLGELNRRLGNYKKSIDWFLLGTKSPAMKLDRFISEEIREQMRKTKTEYKLQNN